MPFCTVYKTRFNNFKQLYEANLMSKTFFIKQILRACEGNTHECMSEPIKKNAVLPRMLFQVMNYISQMITNLINVKLTLYR